LADGTQPREENAQTCRRCYARERIPTHQFVKFDLKEHYLCLRCWEDFRRWFNCGHTAYSDRGATDGG
jgi:hypothetical protein